jgi:hypothetical protein
MEQQNYYILYKKQAGQCTRIVYDKVRLHSLSHIHLNTQCELGFHDLMLHLNP